MRKKIVIAGAGFGGTYVYARLHRLLHGRKDVHITIINRTNYFLFTPLLHEVATGGISPENIVQPIREVLGCCVDDLICEDVTAISFGERQVRTRTRVAPYDYLVIALGSKTNFFSVPGAEKNCFQLKSLADASALKNQFISVFEQADRTYDEKERSKLLTFAVIGGGATGVELACEMSDFFYGTLERYYPSRKCRDRISILLLHQGAELISQFPSALRKRALSRLREKRVDVRLETRVTKVQAGMVHCLDGTVIETATPIWVAGVCPGGVECGEGGAQDAHGRFPVNTYLQLAASPNVFAIGDNASCTPPVPQLAQVATKQARVVANNIINSMAGKPLQPFRYRSSGNLISLGEWDAGAEIGGMALYGRFAWWIWRTVYLLKLHGFEKKFKVAVDWTFDLFSPRDISKL